MCGSAALILLFAALYWLPALGKRKKENDRDKK